MTWKDKLKTLTSKWHPTRTELASIATTGDYNDLINAPQGGGGGNDNIIEVVFSQEDLVNAIPSDLNDAISAGNVGGFTTFSLEGSHVRMTCICHLSMDDSKQICYFNNLSQYTEPVMLYCCTEYNNYLHSFEIGDSSFEISPEQKRYYIGSLKNSEEEPEPPEQTST